MNFLTEPRTTARAMTAEVIHRAKEQRCAMAVGLHEDGRFQASPLSKKEGRRLMETEAAIGVFNALADREELTAALRDRIFAVIGRRMRAKQA